jgi:hypothetical protein
MARIISVREILDDPECQYKAAFDTKTGVIHYYSLNSKKKYEELTNYAATINDLKDNLKDQETAVKLNENSFKNSFYIGNNIFAEGNE